MSYKVSGKMTFLPKNLQKGLIREMKRHVKDTAELNADMVRMSIEREKDIVTGGNFKGLENSTRIVRQERGISGDIPLYATGNLYRSIEVIPDGDGYAVTMVHYGTHQNEGFTPKKIPKFYKGKSGDVRLVARKNKIYFEENTEGIEVPSRRFFDTPKAFFRRKEYNDLWRGFSERFKKLNAIGETVRIG